MPVIAALSPLTQYIAVPCRPAESPKIRQASWECLAGIASGYYDRLPAYMQDVFSLTQRTVSGDEEEVVLQALEFWCTVAEEELDRSEVGRAATGPSDEARRWCA